MPAMHPPGPPLPPLPPPAKAPNALQAPTQPPAAPRPQPIPLPGFFSTIGKWFRANARNLVLVALGALGYAGYRIYDHYQPYEWSGTIEAKTVTIGSRVGGRVKDVLVHEGETVKAGAPLLVLEAGPLEAEKAIAEGELDVAEATYEKLTHGARPEEIAQAHALLAAANAAAAKESARAVADQKEAARAASLYKGGAISAAEQEAKKGAAHAAGGAAAEASARAKEAAAALKLLTGGTPPEDLAVAKANVAIAKAKLAGVNGKMQELTVRAPRDARVESITVRPGDLLRADAPAATLLESGQLYVRLYVPETQLGKIHAGEELPVTVDSFGKRRFRARVDHINDVGEFTPRRLITTEDRANEVFGARVTLLEGEGELRAGMAAFVHVGKR